MAKVYAYSAARYVIGVRTSLSSRKLFQIVFGKDGSLFVTFPYYRSGHGQVGLVHVDSTLIYPTDLVVGENFPATAHYVKYSHHPAGRAHFSLTGKVKSSIGKQACPLFDADGHVFTVMIQGIDRFDEVSAKDQGNNNRGVVVFPFDSTPVSAIKYLGMLYPERTVTKLVRHENPTPWMKVLAPDGSVRPGLLLHTPLRQDGQRYFLMLSAERIQPICVQQEVFMTLMGGFDSPDVAFDHSKPTSWLMFIYPNHIEFDELVRQVGTIDISRDQNAETLKKHSR